jgi:hypothetical protein
MSLRMERRFAVASEVSVRSAASLALGSKGRHLEGEKGATAAAATRLRTPPLMHRRETLQHATNRR